MTLEDRVLWDNESTQFLPIYSICTAPLSQVSITINMYGRIRSTET